MKTVPIQFASSLPRGYNVVVGPGALAELGPRINGLAPASSGRAFLMVDENLPTRVVETVRQSVKTAGFMVEQATIRAVEPEKTLNTVGNLLVRLASTRHERGDPVIALGGGIVGDIAGYVAASYRRGVPFIQCPTTLLSMVDASIGGKTGVNIEVEGSLKKNMAGAFWQPSLVVADPEVLSSLPERHLRSGLAECLKHGLISGQSDAGLSAWTLDHLEAMLARDAVAMSELIERNVRVKASFVMEDEREEKPSSEGGRALLNLGHTFAHAIETVPGLSPTGSSADAPLHHGEAVGLGLVAAAYTSSATDRLSWAEAEGVRRSVELAGLPTKVGGLPDEEAMLASMMHDKKVAGGRLRLVLPMGKGRAVVVVDPPYEAVRIGLTAIRA